MDIESIHRRRFVCAALAVVALNATALPAYAADEVVVGQVTPLTGVVGPSGQEYAAGVAAYFASVNAKGGINGRKVRVVVADDQFKPENTLQLTRDMLMKDRPVALIGFIGSANVLGVVKNKVLSENQIALIAPYTGADSLRTPFNAELFHVRASYSEEAARMVEHLNTVGLKRIAVFHQNDAFGNSGLAGAEAAMAKIGLKPVATGTYDRTKPEDVDAAVAAIVAANPNAVISVAIDRPLAAFLKKLRAAGSAARVFSVSVVNVRQVGLNAGEDLVRGMGVVQVMPYPFAPQSVVAREFLDAMKKYQPDKTVSYTAMESFVGAKVLGEAIRRAGADPSRARVLAQLSAMRQYDVGGLRIDYGPDNRAGSKFAEITVVGRGGRLVR
jgi:branched-chain amino acid transport system substrate-binding protein